MKTLLIVESPTKARTIEKFLGDRYIVLSSYGHIRDLPKSSMGVATDTDFKPTYVIPTDKKKRVADLKRAAKQADQIFLATDEDREGEAIAWHIGKVLGMKESEMKRITFHEITKSAIEKALEAPREIEIPLVDAQQTRRILDRLVGYELSPFLWNKVRRGLSAGRVQSVAMRLIVERERERNAFNREEYWSVSGKFGDGEGFDGKLTHVDGKKLEKLSIKTEEEAKKIETDLQGAPFTVASITKKQATRKPPTPLTTSSLQQEANNKLHFSAKQTMTLAQKLYETGRITYMRTDSMNLAQAFLQQTQSFIGASFGPDYATGTKAYKTKKKGAQEAHEAIRPTDVNTTPESLQGKLEAGQWKLYNLIWSRTVATQMPNAKIERTGIDLKAKDYTFRANGSTIVFDGFLKVYRNAKEKILPELTEGDSINAQSIEAKQHFTEPPARYSDATLVKALEEHGIGRPSTYAPTINTVINRGYVERDDNKKLYPTDTAFIVNDVLVAHFPQIIDFEFTATMEKTLDEIAEGTVEWVPTLEAFYRPFHANLEKKSKDVTYEDVVKERELGTDPKTGKLVVVKNGRYGPYIQVGDWSEEDRKAKKNKPKMVSLLKDMSMETVTLEDIQPLLTLPREVGTTADGKNITAQLGPYGPYIKDGKTNASLELERDMFSITEEEARALLIKTAKEKAEMKKPLAELGEDPETKEPILVKRGRFGPYVTDGKTNVSIPKKIEPTEVTHEMAVEMLAKKRAKQAKTKKKAA